MLGFIAAFLGLPLLTFLPVIAKDVFQQDVGFYSRLMTFSGAGAVVRRADRRLASASTGTWAGCCWSCSALFGMAMAAFSLSRDVVAEQRRCCSSPARCW